MGDKALKNKKGASDSSDESMRISKKEIQKNFDTSIRDGMFFIIEKNTNKVVVQGLIIMRADPILTIEYISNLCRQLMKYKKDAIKNIKGQ